MGVKWEGQGGRTGKRVNEQKEQTVITREPASHEENAHRGKHHGKNEEEGGRRKGDKGGMKTGAVE